EATAQAIDKDGWLHSGDMGSLAENGYFKITGRIKDMIIRGGENIYPKEIEEFIYTHPAVRDVQVIGVPSKDYGEEVMAYVILKDGETLTEDDIKAYVKGHMARHKTPKYVSFIDELPMTASGKIQKFKLREMAVEELGLHDADSIETA
ncbi:MAG: AMP-binding protein, partial [Clostridiales bacterium]